ncbi:G2H3 [Mytilus edulis]|uniref:G2H3 n=1 Tax=Mytilus edulis TaxID=6550 RepID=A0A8S3SSY4_MYTED|nr:G2H3 [Mytilus edulis]
MEGINNNQLDGTSSSASLTELLKGLQQKVNRDDKQEIIVSRRNVLRSAFNALKRHYFDMRCKLYVKFSGEMGDDHGGPRREFFRLAIQELAKSSLFEGEGEYKFFSHNIQKLEENEYLLAGRLLKEIRTNGERDAFLNDHGEWLLDQGYNGAWRLKIEDKDKVVNSLMKQLLFYRTSAEIAHLYDIKWSVIGSNRRAEEEDSIYCWEIFLQDIDEKEVDVSFEELLIFVTGADQIPPAGFSNNIEIFFMIMTMMVDYHLHQHVHCHCLFHEA